MATNRSPTDVVGPYVAEVAPDAEVVLDHEHDRFAWVTLDEAVRRCLPSVVAAGLEAAAASLDRRS
jgi:hypothetical protein